MTDEQTKNFWGKIEEQTKNFWGKNIPVMFIVQYVTSLYNWTETRFLDSLGTNEKNAFLGQWTYKTTFSLL